MGSTNEVDQGKERALSNKLWWRGEPALSVAACHNVLFLFLSGKVSKFRGYSMPEPLKWYDEKAPDNSTWLNALDELRRRAAREGHCFQHVQAITVAIDQYAEKALGNRDYFLNKPYGVG